MSKVGVIIYRVGEGVEKSRVYSATEKQASNEQADGWGHISFTLRRRKEK